ncbi:MAG: glycerate kinase [Actinobacteria bacterium 69-20]|jgi:glycerate kinase|nr:glycerate kinase [Actinomycetota bacterium]OJV23746.1 MAG: glycerate kinase [Actinobacteria bacterium 69-20]
MTTVLLAPDKFKGSLSAAAVCAALAEGIASVRPDASTLSVPIADGGDGTVASAVAVGYERVLVRATDALGRPTHTSYARRGDLAVVELADVVGIAKLPDGIRDPLRASSRGVGEVIAAAISAGCHRLILGVGGSASTDGGAGMLQALGANILDCHGHEIGPGGGNLAKIASLDLSPVLRRMSGMTVTLANDVTNPLLGPNGAARVYGPQKGADPMEIEKLEDGLRRWADAVSEACGRDERASEGAGAAGGVGFAALSVFGARSSLGIHAVLDLVDFSARLDEADLVITGEGAIDEQTLNGKAPAGVAAAARDAGLEVIGVCGRNVLSTLELRRAGFAVVYSLSDLEPDRSLSIRRAGPLVRVLGERIAKAHLSRPAPAGSSRTVVDRLTSCDPSFRIDQCDKP